MSRKFGEYQVAPCCLPRIRYVCGPERAARESTMQRVPEPACAFARRGGEREIWKIECLRARANVATRLRLNRGLIE